MESMAAFLADVRWAWEGLERRKLVGCSVPAGGDSASSGAARQRPAAKRRTPDGVKRRAARRSLDSVASQDADVAVVVAADADTTSADASALDDGAVSQAAQSTDAA